MKTLMKYTAAMALTGALALAAATPSEARNGRVTGASGVVTLEGTTALEDKTFPGAHLRDESRLNPMLLPRLGAGLFVCLAGSGLIASMALVRLRSSRASA